MQVIFKKQTFYLTVDQKPGVPLELSQDGRQSDKFTSEMIKTQKIVELITALNPNDQLLARSLCQSLVVDLVSLSSFLKQNGMSSGIKIDPYNAQYVSGNDIENLFREVRNGLVHPLVGNGLQHSNTKITSKIACPFYFLRGEDAVFDYASANCSSLRSTDTCFGCGLLRLSILVHVLPYLRVSVAHLATLTAKKTRKKLQSNAPFEVLAKRSQ